MGLLKQNALPLYYQVVSDLQDKINSGEFPANSMLPPEIELARKYEVSRNTVRHAIGILANDGLVTRIPGKGTFFLDRKKDFTKDQWVVSSIEDMLEVTKQTRVDLSPMKVLDKPPGFVLRDLELRKWNKVGYSQGLKYRGDKPISYIQIYLPYELGVQIDHKERGDRTVFLFLREKLGIDITRVDQYMTVESWGREDNKSLKVHVGDPKVVVKRIYFSEDHPVELTINHYRREEFSLFYRIFRGR